MDFNFDKCFLQEPLLIGKNEVSFCLDYDGDILIKEADSIRQALGFVDSPTENNEISYDFFVNFITSDKSIVFVFLVNGSSEDNGQVYEIPLSQERKTSIIWKVVEYLESNIPVGEEL